MRKHPPAPIQRRVADRSATLCVLARKNEPVGDKDNLTREEARARAALVTDVRYEVSLDLTQSEGFHSETTLRFACREPGATIRLDLDAPSLRSVELNGAALPLDVLDGSRIELRDLAAENDVRIAATGSYSRTDVGLHRFEDPVDGGVYLNTQLEPFGAHRVFACFDQPDIKGTYRFAVLARPGWEVVSNSPPAGLPATEPEGVRWTFQTTPLMAAICAGPFHVERLEHRGIDLGIFCRRSLAQHLDADELFGVTKAGFDFFESAFAYPYAFGKYDQVFIPESNWGAMENAGCVTISDSYIFRSRVTDARREQRAGTILHELAHMWFGDLVTMRWWDDLWLNESFADYMAVLAQTEATRWKEAWTTFADTEKTWALRQDQLPTTHPIVADIPDVVSIHLNFDGITYAKGAAALRQLVAWVGQERFLEGLRAYFRRHEFGNAELADFLAVLEEASGRDLQAWSKEWLESAGVNTLRSHFDLADDEQIASLSVVQGASADWPTLRSHRLGVGLYDLKDDGLRIRRKVELDAVGERTEVGELVGERLPDLVLVNDGDLTFAKIRLDERSMATVMDHLGDLDDSLARAVCWSACWDMARDGEMPARHYLSLVVNNIGKETKVGLFQTLLGQALSAIYLYGDPANRQAALQVLADASIQGLRGAASGGDHQLGWARSFVSSARSEDHLGTVRDLLDGSAEFEGLTVDTELRWHIVRALATAGWADADTIDQELARDPTDQGARHAAAARAARPDPEAKAAAWAMIVEETGHPLATIEEVMDGFQRFGQEELIEPYGDRFFRALPGVWESKDLTDALAFGRKMYPHTVVSRATVDSTESYLADGELAAPIRRLLLEGCDGIMRALRARAADRAAEHGMGRSGPD
jgi:aminopeptidase N